MSDAAATRAATWAATYANLHGLDLLRDADPDGFAAALTQTTKAGASMPRPRAKESGPASIFRVTPTEARDAD